MADLSQRIPASHFLHTIQHYSDHSHVRMTSVRPAIALISKRYYTQSIGDN